MSVRVMTAAWAVELSAGDKLVLLALADCANDEGRCWPGMKSLVGKTGKCERSVQAAIKALEAAGHLTRDEVPGKGCNYTVHPRIDCAPAKSAPPQKLPKTPAKSAGTPAKSAGKPSMNHKEPSEDSSSGDEPSLRPEHVFESYQELARLLGLAIPRDFTPERRQLVKGRVSQYPLEDFQTVFAKCRDSPFLRGDRGRTPLTFDWLMQKKNFQKALEGNYDR